MGESVWISGKESKATFYTDLHLAPIQQWEQELDLPCWEEGEVLHVLSLAQTRSPAPPSAVTNPSCLPVLELETGLVIITTPLLKYRLQKPAEFWRKKQDNTDDCQRLSRAFQEALGVSSSSLNLGTRHGTHPQSPKDMFLPQSSQQNSCCLCQELLCPVGMVTQAALSKPLAETGCWRVVISCNLCLGWFTKIRKKYIPELEHLWLLYHYCIF